MATDDRIISDHYLAAAARYLARLAMLDGGYTHPGVSGWAHRHQVERGTRDRQDGLLPRLHALGFADRVTARLGSSEAWICRITHAGAGASDKKWGAVLLSWRAPRSADDGEPGGSV